MSTLPNIAILIFANSSKVDSFRKSILHGEDLFDTLTDYTIKKVERTGLPFFHFTEKEQIGEDFGTRFTNAITSVFNKGFENVITIGNDTPQLKTSHLKAAIESLNNGKNVLGPSLDGGFYLLGIHRSDFNPIVFNKLPWQRFEVLNKILNYFKSRNCSVFNLPVLQDIDTIHDVRRLNNFTSTVSAKFRTLLNKILSTGNFVFIGNDVFVGTTIYDIPYNKGSPVQFLH